MNAASNAGKLAPGARIVVRDTEWVIRRSDRSASGGLQLICSGVSELIRSQTGVFDTSLDTDVEVLDPAETELVGDGTTGFAKSRLFVESQLRQAQPSDHKIRIGHLAAMDSVAYQLDPAMMALRQPRQRILIADAVGIGKTLESGILVSELIARGKGRRILVLAVKSMLTQFQKEYWNRFTIPLTRLDSAGIRRVRQRIPTSHNPFHYYDKSIISIDTLKQESEYRSHLEGAYWDIIVIDEAHNVADRGTGSMRSRLAQLLAKRSDTLIMLSATPHDGKARSFASLMNMLDPTAIVDPEDYRKEDFRSKGLVVRRFKKDIRDQVREAFRERKVYSVRVEASPEEEAAYQALLNVKVAQSRAGQSKRDLFSVSLEKALFSSPEACRETVAKRIERREGEIRRKRVAGKGGVGALREEVRTLERLEAALNSIGRHADSRYQALVRAIRDGRPFRWNARKPDDRLVIFTERIPTLHWLAENLRRDLKLRPKQVVTLHGTMSDIDQQRVVERFGHRADSVRLMVCSDVASEGINLHYRCHRLIHYDMPWSLMVFQQRNGRIDRYGQTSKPEIVYLVSESGNETIRGDQRILEILQEKDEQAHKNIGDPSAFMNVHSIVAEERITEAAIASGESSESFDERLKPQSNEGDDLLALFLAGASGGGSADLAGTGEGKQAELAEEEPDRPLSVFPNDLSYCETALHYLSEEHPLLNFTSDREAGSLELDAPEDLRFKFSYYPREVLPANHRFQLTTDEAAMQQAIENSRRDEETWPRKHYLWRQNPVVEWLNDRMLASFGRHEAPVLAGVQGLGSSEAVYAFSGIQPNRKSHPLVCEWCAVIFEDGDYRECVPLEEVLNRTGLNRGSVPNRGSEADFDTLKAAVPEAVDRATLWIRPRSDDFESEINKQLERELADLESLKTRQLEHVTARIAQSRAAEGLKRGQLLKKRKEIEDLFGEYLEWVQDTMTLETEPWLRLLCVMTGES